MKKNARIYIWLDSELKERLIKEAQENNISVCELCRNKLKQNLQLDRIELKLDNLTKSILKNRGLFKAKRFNDSITSNKK